jgi:hypothetical protein
MTIGSSNLRDQPPLLMAPSLLVGFGPEAIRQPGRGFSIAWIAPRQGTPAPPQSQACGPSHGRPGRSSHTQPQSSQSGHFMSLPSLPTFAANLPHARFSHCLRFLIKAVWSGPTCVVRKSSRVGPLLPNRNPGGHRRPLRCCTCNPSNRSGDRERRRRASRRKAIFCWRVRAGMRH